MGRFFREQAVAVDTRASRRAPPGTRAVVVGGGLAGVAAATVLAERGVEVTLVEREPFLGGRAGAWGDTLATGEPFEMERGFHAFFRQYYNVRALLRRLDPSLSMLRPLEDYPILGPDGEALSFSGLPRRTPFNLIGLLAGARVVGLRDLARMSPRAASAMLAFDMEPTFRRFDGTTARDYLISLGLPERARRLLFDVFAHSFFNPEERMSAAELLMMFHFYFLGNPEGLVFDVLREPFRTALFRPLGQCLEGLGARVVPGRSATRVDVSAGGGGRGGARRFRVELDDGRALDADGVVLALSVPGLRAVVGASPGLGEVAFRRSVERLSVTLPFVVLRLWLDRPCAAGRAPFAGTTGRGPLDNISLYHLFEGESERWARRTGGAVVELHAYAVPRPVDEEAVCAALIEGLHAFYPETRTARILERRVLVREDCPAFETGSFEDRPGVESAGSGLGVAGDFVRVPFPTALMERAVSSGFLAANHLLRGWGTQGTELWSVPRKGVLA